MATRESRARCKNDPDLNLLLTNSTLEQPLCSGASRDSLGDEQSAHFGSSHVAPAFRSTFERHWFRRRHWLGGMAVVLDLAKDRGVDPGHGGRIHCGWWRFGASSDCSGRHHPRRWQLILNVVRELAALQRAETYSAESRKRELQRHRRKGEFRLRERSVYQILSDPRTAFREEVARGYGSARCESVTSYLRCLC